MQCARQTLAGIYAAELSAYIQYNAVSLAACVCLPLCYWSRQRLSVTTDDNATRALHHPTGCTTTNLMQCTLGTASNIVMLRPTPPVLVPHRSHRLLGLCWLLPLLCDGEAHSRLRSPLDQVLPSLDFPLHQRLSQLCSGQYIKSLQYLYQPLLTLQPGRVEPCHLLQHVTQLLLLLPIDVLWTKGTHRYKQTAIDRLSNVGVTVVES